MSRHVFLVAAEDSGDALAADVIDALRAQAPDVRVSGVGLHRMRERGAASDVDLGGLAIVGIFDGVRVFGRVRRAVEATAAAIEAANPDAVVLTDSWGFMIRVAEELKKRGSHAVRIKLVGPQVWATRPGRAKSLARAVHHLLCIHAFEQPFYRTAGLPTTVIGNPAIGRMPRGDGRRFRQDAGLAPDVKVIGLLPGSRPSEIRRVAPVLEAAAARLCEGRPDRKVVCVVAGSVEAEVRARAASWAFPHMIVADADRKADAFEAMDVALACSGTVTTELAEQGAPVVVGYKLGWITWAVARVFLMRSRFITLLNVAAGREIAPEFVQTRLKPDLVAAAAERILSEPGAATTQKADQEAALTSMAGPGRPAATIAAEAILGVLAGSVPVKR